MKRFNSRKWITENKYGKLSEMKYDDPFDQEEEDPKNPMGLGEKKDYTSTEDFGTLFPDAMQGGLGKARANMPQVPADDFESDLESPAGDGLETNEPEKIPDLGKATTAYLNSSDDTGPYPKGDQVDVSVEKGIDPMDLKPTQADIYMSNALKKVKSAEEGSWKPWASSVLASNDGHILDGHHRWAATIVYNDKHGTDEKMSINKVGMPIKDLLKVANAYTDAHPKGVRQGGAGTATEGMSPEEWADAKEKERLNQHPEKDTINKIKQMMDKEKDEEQEEYDKGWYGESKLLDRIKEKPTVEERTAVLNYWLSKSPSRSQLPDIFDLDKENYKGNDPLILSYIEKMDQDIPYRILRQENAFFNGELIRMLNHPDDQEYIQMHKDTIVHNGVDPFSNKLTPQNHDVMADEAKADPDLAETKTLKEIAIKLGYLKEIDGMEGGNMSVSNKFDHSKFDFQEKVIKAEFMYTEQGGRFYSLTLSTSDNRQIKLKHNEANAWLKDTLEYIHEDDLIPRKYISGLEDLDLIVDRLKELGIEASHNDFMDVS